MLPLISLNLVFCMYPLQKCYWRVISLLLSKPNWMLVLCSGDAVHRCDGCPRSYRWVKSLIRHQRLECGKKPQFHCTFCEYQAKHKSSLVKHVALKHRVIPSDFSWWQSVPYLYFIFISKLRWYYVLFSNRK